MRTFVFEYFVKTQYRIGVLFMPTHWSQSRQYSSILDNQLDQQTIIQSVKTLVTKKVLLSFLPIVDDLLSCLHVQ